MYEFSVKSGISFKKTHYFEEFEQFVASLKPHKIRADTIQIYTLWELPVCILIHVLNVSKYFIKFYRHYTNLLFRKDKFIWSSKSSSGSWKTMWNNAKRNLPLTKVPQAHRVTKRLENILFEFAFIERWHCVSTTWENAHSLWISF